MGIFNKRTEEDNYTALKDDVIGDVFNLQAQVAIQEEQIGQLTDENYALKQARLNDIPVMNSNRETIDFLWAERDRLRLAAGPFGGFVVGLLRKADSLGITAVDTEQRAMAIAERYVRSRAEAVLVRKKTTEIEIARLKELEDPEKREAYDAEILADLEASGELAQIAADVEIKIHDERRAALIREEIEAAQARAHSEETVAAQRQTIIQELTKDGTLDKINRRANRVREKKLTEEIMNDAETHAAAIHAKNAPAIRAELEATPYIKAKREGAIATKLQELRDQSAEDFMAARTDNDPELAADIAARALADQHRKIQLRKQQAIRKEYSASKSIDVSKMPEGMAVLIQGISSQPHATRFEAILERRNDEFVVLSTRVAESAKVQGSTKSSDTEMTTRFTDMRDHMALVGRTIIQRTGETEWSTEIKLGSMITIRTDDTGENDVQFELRVLKFPSPGDARL